MFSPANFHVIICSNVHITSLLYITTALDNMENVVVNPAPGKDLKWMCIVHG